MVKSHSQNRCVFRRLRNAAKVCVSLIVCDSRAFWSLGAELEKARNPNCVLVCSSAQHEIRRRGCDDEQRGRPGLLCPGSSGRLCGSCLCCRHCRHLGLAQVIQLSLGEIKLLRTDCQAALRQCA